MADFSIRTPDKETMQALYSMLEDLESTKNQANDVPLRSDFTPLSSSLEEALLEVAISPNHQHPTNMVLTSTPEERRLASPFTPLSESFLAAMNSAVAAVENALPTCQRELCVVPVNEY